MTWSRWLLVALLGAASVACSVKIKRETMDPGRLEGPPTARLACPHHLGDVVDARPDGGNVGGLSAHLFTFEDAAGVVRRQLLSSGFSESADAGSSVGVRIVRFYMEGSHYTKIPVVVYEVRVDAQPAFIVRSQKASMNWNGTRNEAYEAYGEAIRDANRQLIGRLNASCSRDAVAVDGA